MWWDPGDVPFPEGRTDGIDDLLMAPAKCRPMSEESLAAEVDSGYELTFLFPCLNEAETVQACIWEVRDVMSKSGLVGEILVADNGSTDGSQDLAREAGARVMHARHLLQEMFLNYWWQRDERSVPGFGRLVEER